MNVRLLRLLSAGLPVAVLLGVLAISWTVAQGDTVLVNYQYDRAGRLIQADYGTSVYFYQFRRGGTTPGKPSRPNLHSCRFGLGTLALISAVDLPVDFKSSVANLFPDLPDTAFQRFAEILRG